MSRPTLKGPVSLRVFFLKMCQTNFKFSVTVDSAILGEAGGDHIKKAVSLQKLPAKYAFTP